MTKRYDEYLENKPERLRPDEFVKSIWNLSLQNPFLPEFDDHVRNIVSSMGLASEHNPNIGCALRRQAGSSSECEDCALPHSLKSIILGYCITHGWKVWASLERGTPARIVPSSLIEAPHFTISTDFSCAMYGALRLPIFRVDRMDLMKSVGSPDEGLSIWSEFEVMNAVKLQEVRPDGNRCRAISLERLLSGNELSGNLETIPRSVRQEIGERTKAFWVDRRLIVGGLIDPVVSEGMIEISENDRPVAVRQIGRPHKRELVQIGFFFWLELMKDSVLPGITTAKKKIEDLLIEMNQQNIVEDTAHHKTIRDQLLHLGYLVKIEGSPIRYEWVPKAWKVPFAAWKKAEKSR